MRGESCHINSYVCALCLDENADDDCTVCVF